MRRVGTRQGLTWDLHCRTAVLGTVQYRLLPKTVHKRPRDNRSLRNPELDNASRLLGAWNPHRMAMRACGLLLSCGYLMDSGTAVHQAAPASLCRLDLAMITQAISAPRTNGWPCGTPSRLRWHGYGRPQAQLDYAKRGLMWG